MNVNSHEKFSRARQVWCFVAAALFGWGILACLFIPGEFSVLPGQAGGIVHAQAAGGDTPVPAAADVSAPSGPSLLSNVTSAGWIGMVIIVCSVIGFSLAITFAFQLRRDSLVPPEVLGQVEQCFEEENYEEAYEVCEGNPSFFSAVLAAGLSRIDRGWEEIENSMVETGDTESNKLHQKVGWLSVIASIAPMLGLFGTVYGMIKTFNVIAHSATQPKPQDLAGGISLALVTTFMGLLVAIPMTVLFVVFRNKVVSTVLEVGTLTEDLMERFKDTK